MHVYVNTCNTYALHYFWLLLLSTEAFLVIRKAAWIERDFSRYKEEQRSTGTMISTAVYCNTTCHTHRAECPCLIFYMHHVTFCTKRLCSYAYMLHNIYALHYVYLCVKCEHSDIHMPALACCVDHMKTVTYLCTR